MPQRADSGKSSGKVEFVHSSLDWETIFQAIGQPTVILDSNHNIVVANQATLKATGMTAEELSGSKCFHFFHGPSHSCPPDGCPLQRMLDSGTIETMEMEMEVLGGVYLVATTPVMTKDGKLDKIIHIATDVTELRKGRKEKMDLEQQLRQAQKMEAIGRLAGGIAHDFNNLLSVILGYVQFAGQNLEPDHPSVDDLTEIRTAAERAADLTRQLLAFGRRQMLDLKVLNLNDSIGEAEKMISRVIGEQIVIELKLDSKLGNLKADPAQIQQILMNLMLNARDSMPGGGRVVIETSMSPAEEFRDELPGEEPPPFWVVMRVTDEGTGMDAETRSRVFEPFFTTKQPGKGTGLGLATVYGITMQHKGHITVDSEQGKGTTFSMFLPGVDQLVDKSEADFLVRKSLQGETILVAEDEDAVRRLACRILKRHGCEVLEARNGEEAIDMSSEHPGSISLLLTDVVMPGKSGKDLHKLIEKDRPGLKVVYMSGYADDVVDKYGVLGSGTRFLQKPFSIQSLMRIVSQVLG